MLSNASHMVCWICRYVSSTRCLSGKGVDTRQDTNDPAPGPPGALGNDVLLDGISGQARPDRLKAGDETR
jgi:hypothetical protein